MRNTKQKAKDNRIQRNARNLKNRDGVRLLDRADRLKEINRRREVP